MPYDKHSRRLYDQQRRAKLSNEERRAVDMLRNERRKRRRAAVPHIATSVTSMSPSHKRTLDKQSRRLYDQQRRAKLSNEERRAVDMLRNERRKRRRASVPHTATSVTSTSPSHTRTLGLVATSQSCPDPFEVKVEQPCKFCGAKRFQHEPPAFCCRSGKVSLAPFELPPALQTLYESNDAEAIEFREHIRAYNSIFAFTSFGVKLDKTIASSKRGIYTFKVHGQAYHDLPSLLPSDTGPCFFQLYFYDTEHEVENRLGKLADASLNPQIVLKLISILNDNPYGTALRRLRDIPLDTCELHIRSDAQLDQRVYNRPTTTDVAAIWVEGNNSPVSSEREILVTAKSGNRHRVQHYFGCYDPLQYPLLFPYGENGWHQYVLQTSPTTPIIPTCPANLLTIDSIYQNEDAGVLSKNKKRVSCREYYCYKLQIRDDTSVLLKAKRLLLQFSVDMYIKIESTRLDYCRKNQHKLRAELYQGIVDSVLDGEKQGHQIGKRIVLPASFNGGYRNTRCRYLNSMALVQNFGKPDLFITMTSNPEWKEITRELLEGQTAQDRPDLVCRVFRAKLQDLKDQLFKKHIFGRVAAHVHVVEFQKRGLPHAHILIILESDYKITSVDEQFESFVCAEIPDESTNPDLHKKVIKHMMHGPCGTLNPKNSCMVNNRCKSYYPRPFCEHTMEGDNSYPIYRRRSSGPKVTVRKRTLDNGWVVPYNPYLLTRYDCHINVEICSNITAVKYIYKHINKGHDMLAFDVCPNAQDKKIDEISQFQEGRCVTSIEAIWRIFGFELHEISPAVIPLQLHLPNNHVVSFQDLQKLEKVLEQDTNSMTMLTEYFSKCAADPDARQYLYKDFPKHYVWDKQGRIWTKRQSSNAIGRLCAANPSEGERYYLRLLLNNVRGPTSFSDLLTVNQVQCRSFKEAATKRGLLASNDYISQCLYEVSSYQMPEAFRRLFASVLVYLQPLDTKQLLSEHFASLSADFQSVHKKNVSACKYHTLKRIAYYLESMGSNLGAFELPSPTLPTDPEASTVSQEILSELSVETPPEDSLCVNQLNAEQSVAFTTILERAYSNISGAFFIDGPGGSGKTFLYRALLWAVRSRNDIALATATSGVAAGLLPGGRTAHSRFGIPLISDESSMCAITKQSATAELIRRARLIIWDEASMSKRNNIEALDRSLQDIMSSNTIFGGKVIIFGGDFRQVLPVVTRGTRGQVVSACLAKSYLWPLLEKLQLKQNMRAQSDPLFTDLLLRIGDGEEPTVEGDVIELPQHMILTCPPDIEPADALINHIYPSLRNSTEPASYFAKRAILATKNQHVDHLNEKIITMFPGKSWTYQSFDAGIDDSKNFYTEEFLNGLMPTGFPPHLLTLKPNCPIILLRNIDPANGLCNGTRLFCKSFEPNIIHAEISVGQHAGKTVFLHRIQFIPIESEDFPFRFIRSQFPVRLAFSMTVNRSQGQTIPHVGVYLPEGVFSHGQLYVALSRGTSMLTTSVITENASGIHSNDSRTKNIVYKEVLQT